MKYMIRPSAVKPIIRVTNPLNTTGFVGYPEFPPQEIEIADETPIVEITNGVNPILTITMAGQFIVGERLLMDDVARAFLEAINLVSVGRLPLGIPSHR